MSIMSPTTERGTLSDGSTRLALIADADARTCKHTADILRKFGWVVETVATSQSAQDLIVRKTFDVTLIDSALAGNDDLQLLERIQSLRPSSNIILTTSTPDVDEAVEAIRRGAVDYMTQPVEIERVATCIEHLDGQSVREHADQAPRAMPGNAAKTFISGNPQMLALLEAAAMVAGTKATILITGESGTGKEVLAAHIHRAAAKPDLPFVAVNCAALPDTLIESELFGHEKGAFTGATQRKRGKFEQVGEGTLVLDEIGDMPLALQPKILRVLQERRIERLGGAGDRPFNGQVVAITHQDLETVRL